MNVKIRKVNKTERTPHSYIRLEFLKTDLEKFNLSPEDRLSATISGHTVSLRYDRDSRGVSYKLYDENKRYKYISMNIPVMKRPEFQEMFNNLPQTKVFEAELAGEDLCLDIADLFKKKGFGCVANVLKGFGSKKS